MKLTAPQKTDYRLALDLFAEDLAGAGLVYEQKREYGPIDLPDTDDPALRALVAQSVIRSDLMRFFEYQDERLIPRKKPINKREYRKMENESMDRLRRLAQQEGIVQRNPVDFVEPNVWLLDGFEVQTEERNGLWSASWDYDDKDTFATYFEFPSEEAALAEAEMIADWQYEWSQMSKKDARDDKAAWRRIRNAARELRTDNIDDILEAADVDVERERAERMAQSAVSYLERSGQLLEQNPRRSRIKDALANEARKFERFDDFEQSYWNECSRGIYWIATSDPEFRMGPREMALSLDGKLFAYCSPFEALKGPNATQPFIAEIDLGALDRGVDFEVIEPKGDDGYTSVIKINRADLVRTVRVIPSEKGPRVHNYARSLLPVSKEELMDVWLISNSPDEISAFERRKRRRIQREERRQRLAREFVTAEELPQAAANPRRRR